MSSRDRLPLDRRVPLEIREEIRFYLEERAAEFMEEGMGEAEAWKAALDAFGDVGRIEAEVEEIDRKNGRKTMWRERAFGAVRNIRQALRSMRKNPGFTVVALFTLALGLGANTAIYSVVHAALFRAPPVEDAHELVAVYTTSRRGFPRSSTSWPDFLDYREQADLLDGLAATSTLPASLGDDARGARFISIETITGNFFDLVGVEPALGRLISEDDDLTGAGSPVAVLSDALWRSHFDADPTVVGRSVRLNGAAFTVIGVTPHDYAGLSLGFQADAWIPMQAGAFLGQGAISGDTWQNRGSRWMGMSVGRMKDGVAIEQVRDQFFQISEGLKAMWPDERGPRNTTVDPLGTYALPTGAEAQVSRFVWLLLGVVGFTLLLACANVANLLLARATVRTREIAVRLSLGASRTQLVGQLLTESLTLSLLGGALGVLLAAGLLQGLSGFELPGGLAISTLRAGLSAPVLVFTLVASVVTGLVFGLVPTLQASRPDVVKALKGESEGARGGTSLRKALIAVQVGMCLVLLVGSALFVRTLREGMSHELGFDSEGVAVARFNLGLLNYESAEAMAFIDQLRGRLEANPAVESASVATCVPLVPGGARGFFFRVPGYDASPDEELRVDLVGVSPAYFRSLGVPLLEGRGIESGDQGSDAAVVVINRAMAEQYWNGRSPLGQTVELSGTAVRVVGVVDDLTWRGLDDTPTNFMYIPMGLQEQWAAGFVTVTARGPGDPGDLLPILRTEIRALESDAPITVLSTMETQVGAVLTAQQMAAAMLSGFGLLALVLAALGIAGVVTYTVNQQRRDIGIRMALGAERGSVMRQVAQSMTVPLVVGVVGGLLSAYGLTRFVESFLFGVSATDPATYSWVTGALFVVAAMAAVVPARKATRVDPIEVLRAE